MSSFDYPYLTTQLSNEGFNHCVSLLFPLFGFKYITADEVRQVDLCERINEFTKYYPIKPGQKKDMTFEAYCEVIDYHIQNSLKCKNGTIAGEYRNRAIEILKELKEVKDTHAALEKCLTLFSIFLSLLRAIYPKFSKIIATDAHLMVDKMDAELLAGFREYRFKNNNFLGIETPSLFKKPEVQTIRDTDMVYIHNILLFCLLMEIQGEYKRGVQ